MRDGPSVALPLIEEVLEELKTYHLAHAVHADLCRRLGREADALASYERALSLAQQEPERRFLKDRISALTAGLKK
jgi:RNA polymerase sigma-70 factor (ECF subfamily)